MCGSDVLPVTEDRRPDRDPPTPADPRTRYRRHASTVTAGFRCAAGAQPGEEVLLGQRVDHPVLLHPTAAGVGHTPREVVVLAHVVAVGGDGEPQAGDLHRGAQLAGGHVETVEMRVDLEGGTGLGGGGEHCREVELDPGSSADAPPGEVADGIHPGVLDGSDHPLGLLGLGEVEQRVDAGHTPVEAGQHLVVVVDVTVAGDVQLGALEDGELGVLLAQAARSPPARRRSPPGRDR